MKPHQHVNSFEVAVAGMITIGFVLIGIILFSGLTPRLQTNVASAANMFDIHEQVAQTTQNITDEVGFVMDVPNQFYNQFYIAFVQLATLPPGSFDMPIAMVREVSRNFSVAVNNLSIQVAQGYSAQNNLQSQGADIVAQATEDASQGKVLGAVIDLSDKVARTDLLAQPMVQPNLNITYNYSPPDLTALKSELIKYFK